MNEHKRNDTGWDGKSSVDVEMRDSFERFPFFSTFDEVAHGRVSYVYLRSLRDVLASAMDVLGEQIKESSVDPWIAEALYSAAAAHGRICVAIEYQEDVRACGASERSDLSNDMLDTWVAYIEDNGLVDVGATALLMDWMTPLLRTLWRDFSVVVMPTATVLMDVFGSTVRGLRVRELSSVLVESAQGCLLSELGARSLVKPVLPMDLYARILADAGRVVSSLDSISLFEETVRSCQEGKTLGAHYYQWYWVILTAARYTDGYCYQFFFEPAARYMVVKLFGPYPLVSDVLGVIDEFNVSTWCDVDAEVDYGDVLHVTQAGIPDLDKLRVCKEKKIGSAAAPAVDYYARALVDDFIARSRARSGVSAPAPVDEQLGALTLATGGPPGGFVDVAAMFYSSVGASLSPRARTGSSRFAGGGNGVSDRPSDELDVESLSLLYDRLCDGAVVNETYYEAVRKRFPMRVRSPRLDGSGGRALHVFEGCPADGTGSTDCWREDKDWNVPGWKSYTATFSSERRIVNYVDTGQSVDIRIDCSGDGTIHLDSCHFPVQGTVLWFTRSVKLQVSTKRRVTLRVSVPDGGTALAVGLNLRMFLHLPGYAVAIRSYDMSTRVVDFAVPVSGRRAMSGCDIRLGSWAAGRGKHRFKFAGLSGSAPVKYVVRAKPVSALAYVIVGRVKLQPGARDYVTVICDFSSTSCYIELDEYAEVSFSVLQIVDVKQFESVARSAAVARDASDRV